MAKYNGSFFMHDEPTELGILMASAGRKSVGQPPASKPKPVLAAPRLNYCMWLQANFDVLAQWVNDGCPRWRFPKTVIVTSY